MKHLDKHISESIFDTDVSDIEILKEEIRKIFAGETTRRMEYNISDDTLEPVGPYVFRASGHNIMKAWSMLPDGVHKLHSKEPISIESLKDVNKYIDDISCESIIMRSCTGVTGMHMAVRGEYIFSDTNVYRSELLSLDSVCRMKFMGTHSKNLEVKGISTDVSTITIQNYDTWEIESDSQSIRSAYIIVRSNPVFGRATHFGNLVQDLYKVKYRMLDVREIMHKYRDEGILRQINPSADLGIHVPNLQLAMWIYKWSAMSFKLYFFRPNAIFASSLVSNTYSLYKDRHKTERGNRLYKLADGWLLGYEIA